MKKENYATQSEKEMAEKQTQKKTKQEIACEYLRENYIDFDRIRYDEIAQKVQIRDEADWRYITDADINTIVCDCCYESGKNISTKEIMTVLKAGRTYIPHVHPLREYVHSRKPYYTDKIDFIDMVANSVILKYPEDASEEECERLHDRWRACFRMWFVAMVASWLDDEVVNHHVLVLVGKQGIYKTTFLEYLLPPELRHYCCKLANTSQLNKDDRFRLAEFGLINLDELDAMSPREVNVMKSVITAADVNERAAWGYVKERRMRLASFCASCNNRYFLSDITGNRRWLPFEVEDIRDPRMTFNEHIYNGMYAQALEMTERGFQYWFDKDQIAVIEQHNEDFRARESEEELLSVYLDVPAEDAQNAQKLTTAEIAEKLTTLGNLRYKIPNNRLGMLLSQRGFKPVRFGTPRRRGWLVYVKEADQVNNERGILG